MSTELVKFDGEDVDQFFDHEVVVTDWNATLSDPGNIDMASEIEQIKKHEPVTPGHPFEHQIWVRQQRLRIALRHNAGLPRMGHTCTECGTNLEDPVLKMCLVCAEFKRQVNIYGSRGSCFFVKPCWDIETKSWGLLYYCSWSDDTFMFWLAKGYVGYTNVCKALMPVSKYEDWLNRRYNGIGNFWHLMDNLFPLEELMEVKKELPWTPEQFKEQLKGRFKEHMGFNHNILSYAIDRALDDYERDQHE